MNRAKSIQKHTTEIEQIDLLRGGSIVSSLAGAFGKSLRETRLTAMLGYLIALDPAPFCKIFGFQGTPVTVRLETRHATDRSDILIETTAGLGVIEAKVTATDPLQQASKYPAKWHVLLTEYIASEAQKRIRGVRYYRWRDLMQLLVSQTKANDNRIRFVSWDLLKYLEEHALIKSIKPLEVYAREINNDFTLNLFLKAQLYGCNYQKEGRLSKALYFAPHFGKYIADEHPGVRVGISYIAGIEKVEIIEDWKGLLQVVQENRGKYWLKRHKDFIDPLKKQWDWEKGSKRYFLFLSKPRLVFNPPVIKEKLQTGKGWLSKRFFSFDELFEGWGC